MDHYYDWHGEPQYEIKGANGKIRPTTLRDAKKHNFLPSCTTIMKLIDKPGLNLAKNRLVAEEMFKMFFDVEEDLYESDLDYMTKEAIRRANKHWEDDAKTGNIVHDAIENSLTAPLDYNPNQEVWLRVPQKSVKVSLYVGVVNEWLLDNKIEIDDTEVTCVNNEYGYAGKIDVTATYKGEPGIIDWKTTKTKPKDKAKDLPWDSHPQQIAAYSKARFDKIPSWGCNVYLSTTEIDPYPRLEAVWWDRETLEKNYDKFIKTFELWKCIKNYQPTH